VITDPASPRRPPRRSRYVYQVGIALCTNPRISAGPLAWMRYRRSPGASNSLRINLSSASV